MSKHLFISHSSADVSAAVRICEILESQGIRCWIAPRDVRPGYDYDEEIVEGIEATRAIIVVLSRHANNSEHVKREVELAAQQGGPIFPVLIEEVEPGKKLKYRLTGKQWIDAWQPPLEARLTELCVVLREYLGPIGRPVVSVEPNRTPDQPAAEKTPEAHPKKSEQKPAFPFVQNSTHTASAETVTSSPQLLEIVRSVSIQHSGMGYTDNRAQVFAKLKLTSGNAVDWVFRYLESLVRNEDTTVADAATLLLIKQHRNPNPETIRQVLTLMQTCPDSAIRRFAAEDVGSAFRTQGKHWPQALRDEAFDTLEYVSSYDDRQLVRWEALSTLSKLDTERAVEHLFHVIQTKQEVSGEEDWNHAVMELSQADNQNAAKVFSRLCADPQADAEVLKTVAYWISCYTYHFVEIDDNLRKLIVAGMRTVLNDNPPGTQAVNSAVVVLMYLEPVLLVTLLPNLLSRWKPDSTYSLATALRQTLTEDTRSFWAAVKANDTLRQQLRQHLQVIRHSTTASAGSKEEAAEILKEL